VNILLGCISDDITGGTDLALMLGKHGMPVTQIVGLPSEEDNLPESPGVVISLKTRTAPVREAIEKSTAACRWLLARGARQIFFKYCSTFDSTTEGNIGPVAEALLDETGDSLTVVCPAFPDNLRTVYQGHLFIGRRLLSESGMRHHPLTPMTDPDLVRVLGQQVRSADTVGLISYPVVDTGPETVGARMAQLESAGKRFAVTDVLNNEHLVYIGRACSERRLITGGSGVAMGLPANFRQAGLLEHGEGLLPLKSTDGPAAIIAGSCSEATRAQIHELARKHPVFSLDPIAISEGRQGIEHIVGWAKRHLPQGPLGIASTAAPQEVAEIQKALGREKAGPMIETILAETAAALKDLGVTKWIVAGGETSGAVLASLGIRSLRIGPEIEPGVPWTVSTGPQPLYLALKSGNFGGINFFEKALEMVS